MALNHDENGFLSGPRVSDDLGKISRDIEILKGIRHDTKLTVSKLDAIARGLAQSASRPPPDVPRNSVSTRTTRAASNDSNGGGRNSSPSPRPAPARPAPAPPEPPRSPSTRRQRPDAPNDAAGDATRRQRRPGEPRRAGPDVSERTRAANGRFGSDPDTAPSVGGGAGGRLGAAGESARNAVTGVAHGADNLDPSIQAAKEVGGIVAPITGVLKPLGRVFGLGRNKEDKRQRENVTWYRRIWNSVKGDKGGKGGMGLLLTGLLSMLGMLLAPLRALGRMLGAMRAIAALGGLLKGLGALGGMGRRGARGASGRGAGRGAGAGAGRGGAPTAEGARRGARGTGAPGADGRSARSGAGGAPGQTEGRRAGRASRTAEPVGGAGAGARAGGGMLKGALRKLPLIGALFGGAMIANDLMADDDPNLTPEENKKNRYSSVGAGVGGVVGGVVGMLGGPAGAIAGAMLGDKLGEMVGGWLATVDLAAIPGMITGWLATVDLTAIPGKLLEAFTGLKDATVAIAGKAFDFIKDGWKGILDVGAKALTGMVDWAKDAWSDAKETFLEVKDTVDDKIQTASDYVGEKATAVKDAGQNLLSKATGGRYEGGSNARKDAMIKAMDDGGITDVKSKAALMASVDNETGGFTRDTENLNYSAKGLMKTFPKYYKTEEAARADANNPEAIANKVYGGRMGNKDPGDGYKYRGRGNLQLTGKSNYEAMSKKLGVDFVNNPELAADPKYSAQIAVEHWKSSGADKAAAGGDADKARRIVNGGNIGMEHTRDLYNKYLPQAQAGDLTPTRRADEVKVQAPAAASAAIAGTMATVKGATAVSAAPAVPPTLVARPAGAMGASTVGVMAAPTTAPATAGLSAPKPISTASMMAPTYSAPAPDASALKVSPTPAVEKPMTTPGKAPANPTVQLSVPLTQTVDDRKIAHVSSGGIGM